MAAREAKDAKQRFSRDCAIVLVWIPRGKDDLKQATSLTGENFGHAAVWVTSKTLGERYISQWPGGWHNAYQDWYGEEWRTPDVIVPLFFLDVNTIIATFDSQPQPPYGLCVSKDAAENGPADQSQSCASLVWRMLSFANIDAAYDGGKPDQTGPTDRVLRKRFLSDGPSWFWQLWDGAGWRSWIMSPKLIAHFAASAYEMQRATYSSLRTYEETLVQELGAQAIDDTTAAIRWAWQARAIEDRTNLRVAGAL